MTKRRWWSVLTDRSLSTFSFYAPTRSVGPRLMLFAE